MKKHVEREESDCCGARIKFGDICAACGEHCEIVEVMKYKEKEEK